MTELVERQNEALKRDGLLMLKQVDLPNGRKIGNKAGQEAYFDGEWIYSRLGHGSEILRIHPTGCTMHYQVPRED
jgi:hypothetical protein